MRLPAAALLATLLAAALTACSSGHDSRRNLRPSAAPSPSATAAAQRAAMPLTSSAFLLPADQPASHALGRSWLLLPHPGKDAAEQHRQHAACLGLRLALQQAERSSTQQSSQLMLPYWPLQHETSLYDCGQLVDTHDFARARQLLGPALSAGPGPLLTARALDGNQLLVLDLSDFSDSDLRRIMLFWVNELGSDPQYWNPQGFAMERIQQALNGYLLRYGRHSLQVLQADQVPTM